MKKLLLLIGLVVFISITAESLESIFNTDLPECKIIKNKKLTADQKRLKKLGRDVVLLDKIETTTTCYGEIIINYDCTYKGEFQNRKKHGYGELWCSAGIHTQLWEKGKLVKNYSSIEVRELKIELGIIKTVKEEFYCEGLSGNVYKTPVGCINNISITEQEYAKRIAEQQESDDTNDVEVFCYNKELKGKRNSVMIFKNKCNEKRGWEKASDYQIERKLALMTKNKYDLKQIETLCSRIDCDEYGRIDRKRNERSGQVQKKKTASFNELALSLGCGSKSKDVKDCVRRYLPSIAGTSPMTLEQIKEISKDKELMGEIVHSIAEMNRQKNQSKSEPSEKEKQQALAQQNSSGQATWKSTAGGIWYWDYGNGFGWAPPNPIRDKIIQGLMVSQRTKNMLKTGSRGRTIFIPR